MFSAADVMQRIKRNQSKVTRQQRWSHQQFSMAIKWQRRHKSTALLTMALFWRYTSGSAETDDQTRGRTVALHCVHVWVVCVFHERNIVLAKCW